MKATKAQILTRTEEILRIRLDGAQIYDVREYVRQKEREEGSAWHLAPAAKPLSDSQLWRYMARADKMMAESCRASAKKLHRRHLAQRRHLYGKAVLSGELDTALRVLRDEAELLGLYPPRKTALTNPAGDREYGELSADDRLAALAALRAAVGPRGGGEVAGGQDDADRPVLDRPGPDPDRGRDDAGPVAG
jgi:hypothetical protein